MAANRRGILICFSTRCSRLKCRTSSARESSFAPRRRADEYPASVREFAVPCMSPEPCGHESIYRLANAWNPHHQLHSSIYSDRIERWQYFIASYNHVTINAMCNKPGKKSLREIIAYTKNSEGEVTLTLPILKKLFLYYPRYINGPPLFRSSASFFYFMTTIQ